MPYFRENVLSSRKSVKEPVKEEIEWEDRVQAVPTRHPTLPY
jgi:hypothetical protein